MRSLFDRLWERFPQRFLYPDMSSLRGLVNGLISQQRNASVEMVIDDCAIRLSIALAQSGHRIDEDTLGALRLKFYRTGRDFPVVVKPDDMCKYLARIFRQPDLEREGTAEAFPGEDRKGIVKFNLYYPTGECCHLQLYDGTNYRDPEAVERQYTRPQPLRVNREFWEL